MVQLLQDQQELASALARTSAAREAAAAAVDARARARGSRLREELEAIASMLEEADTMAAALQAGNREDVMRAEALLASAVAGGDGGGGGGDLRDAAARLAVAAGASVVP
jgi:hypothetical protein